MAVVAVLLIHIDRKAVTPMNPSINLKKWRKMGFTHTETLIANVAIVNIKQVTFDPKAPLKHP